MKQQKERTFLKDLLNFQGSLNGQSKLLDKVRLKGAEGVRNTSFPTKKLEDWKFISLRDLYRDSYELASNLEVEASDISEHYLPESEGSRLVFVNGSFSAEHSSTDALPDEVVIGNIAQLAADDNDLIKDHLNKYVENNFENDVFSSFNSAFLKDGAFIYVPEDVTVEAPVHLLYVQTDADENYFTTSRSVVVADKNSEITIVEDHIGLADNKYFNLPVVEVNLEEDAYVKHTKIQRDSREAIHIARTAAFVDHHADYESYTITLGAKLSRNEPRISQRDEEVEFTVDGLVLIDGEQVSDTHSVMDHRFSHAESHQLHKCVINGKAHSVFNGKIFVRQDAQKIDSFQENRNLLLSRKGLVNTKPQLEIFADDVVCTHGATVGQLEEDELFYLKSRGLNEQQARELLIYAFALETIENITVDSVQELLVDEVHKFTERQLDSELTV
ncbi:Iron-regulated ABC transporter permease protein SufD [Fodinibius salinus]|uniref:Iron-regulated ABC transporter permease protein SufD n=1 Tax=Fodinibius salinus TaxID=860790 RepID=A0A5D3YM30_9BACT|nr:Fe-S cluster assembly protein SufD [Fodinibius salinus]TYP95206.1 Iron-regulated ABC transporter permease protein SufD [Fodinibius salinus]